MAGRLFLGTSGYVYPHWRGPFYSPPVKASRFLTHMKRLKDADRHFRLFLQRARHVGPRLGLVLFQLPHSFHVNVERLDGLLRALDRQRMVRGLRAVLEVRHDSWLVPDVYARLRRADVALCLQDSRRLSIVEPVTARFVYVRRHGLGLTSDYPERNVKADAGEIRRWLRDGRDVYVYYNNDARGFAVANAGRLAELLGSAAGRPASAHAATRASSSTASSRYTRLIRPRAA